MGGWVNTGRFGDGWLQIALNAVTDEFYRLAAIMF
jgi:hypothetical protein